MRAIIAIRTHRWTEEEERLLAALRTVPGHDLAVVFHNRPADLTPPLDVVDIGAPFLRGNGLRVVPDWGWRCGDYFYYALRKARPGYSHYWLIEPDVHFMGDAAEFFGRFADVEADALGLNIMPFSANTAFARGLTGIARYQAIFALTRLSGRAIDRLLALRQDYGKKTRTARFYTNDELFTFSHVVADPELTHRDFKEIAPDWFEGARFAPSPDILIDLLKPAADGGGRLYHPVHGRASFKRALAARLSAGNAFLRNVRESIGALSDEDLDEVAERVADAMKSELKRWNRAVRPHGNDGEDLQ